MTSLGALAPGYTGSLDFANDINDSGDITGQAVDPTTGDYVTFKAVPVS